MSLQFRKAIETAIENNEEGEFFRKFPTGQCGNTSDILAQYFIDNGIKPIIYVSGTYYGDNWDDQWSHAWLEVYGQIVDLTGDQFRCHKKPLQNNIPVYVGKMNSFYKSFDICPESGHEHLGLEPKWSNYRELMRTYHTILKYLNNGITTMNRVTS